MYGLKLNSRFRKSVKKLKSNRSFDEQTFEYVVLKLRKREILEIKFRDHALKGDMAGLRECHIAPDILLVYEYFDQELILHLVNIGSHSDLF